MLRAFVDDSGSAGDSPWFVLAGYVASTSNWDGFEPRWRAVLDAEPRIAYFHASEAESFRGEFRGVTADQRNSKVRALTDVIAMHARQAVSIRLRQNHYNEVIKGNVPPNWDNAYYFLFPGIVQAVIAMERHMGIGEAISIVFDSSQNFEKRSLQQYAQVAEHPLFANCIIDISYEDDKQFVPLQAADLLAWQIRRAYSVTTEPRRRELDSCRNCSWPSFDSIITKEDLQSGLFLMEERAKRVASALGVPLGVVQDWKKK